MDDIKKAIEKAENPEEEVDENDWNCSAVNILVQNGKDGYPIVLTPMQDDEGNDAGAIATNIDGIEILPVI